MTSLHRREFLAASGAALAMGPCSSITAAEPKLPFELGLVTYNVAQSWDLATILAVCQKTGICAVECRTTHKHGVEPSLSKAQRADIKKQFADSGIVFWGCGSVCEFHSPKAEVVKQNIETCHRFAELVADLGGKGVKVRPNALPKEVPVEKTLEQIGKALRPCGATAASLGIEIWVEVHGPGTQEPKHMKTIMEHCGHPAVGVTWNSNPTDVKNGSVAESFALLRPWIKSCHINDLSNDAKKVYPYKELFRLLREAGYNRYTLIEYAKSFPNVDEGMAFLADYRKQWLELVTATA